jgi:hypothetical protein
MEGSISAAVYSSPTAIFLSEDFDELIALLVFFIKLL